MSTRTPRSHRRRRRSHRSRGRSSAAQLSEEPIDTAGESSDTYSQSSGWTAALTRGPMTAAALPSSSPDTKLADSSSEGSSDTACNPTATSKCSLSSRRIVTRHSASPPGAAQPTREKRKAVQLYPGRSVERRGKVESSEDSRSTESHPQRGRRHRKARRRRRKRHGESGHHTAAQHPRAEARQGERSHQKNPRRSKEKTPPLEQATTQIGQHCARSRTRSAGTRIVRSRRSKQAATQESDPRRESCENGRDPRSRTRSGDRQIVLKPAPAQDRYPLATQLLYTMATIFDAAEDPAFQAATLRFRRRLLHGPGQKLNSSLESIQKLEELLRLVLSIRKKCLPVVAKMRGQKQIATNAKFSLKERDAVVDAYRKKVEDWMPNNARTSYLQQMRCGLAETAAGRLRATFHNFAHEMAGKKGFLIALIQFPLPIEATDLAPLMKRIFHPRPPRR